MEVLFKATVDGLGAINVLVNKSGIIRDNLMLRLLDKNFDEV